MREPSHASFWQLAKTPLLTAEEERSLIVAAQAGDVAARQKLITANIRLVISIARSYVNATVQMEDAIGEGVLGLSEAIDRFDLSRGRFSTYAVWWVHHYIQRAVFVDGKLIRTPYHAILLAKRLERLAHGMAGELGRDPADWELAEAVGEEEERVLRVRLLCQEPVSLDTPVTEDGSRLGELQPAPEEMEPEAWALNRTEQQEAAGTLAGMLRHLAPRERSVIELRFGLDGRGERTLEEIAAILCTTRIGALRLEKMALTRLRRLANPSDSCLSLFTEDDFA